MHRSQPLSRIIRSAVFTAIAAVVLFAGLAPSRQSDDRDGANASSGGIAALFERWTSTSTAEAAPRKIKTAEAAPRKIKRVQRSRISKKARAAFASHPGRVRAAAVAPMWPALAANIASTEAATAAETTAPRAAPKPQSDASLVFENELSDIDLAAAPTPSTADTSTSTDGRSAADAGDLGESTQVFAMGDAIKAIAQSSWLEPLLLMLACAMATMTAVRIFA